MSLIGSSVTAHVPVSESKTEVHKVYIMDKVRKSGIHQIGSSVVPSQWDEYVVRMEEVNKNHMHKVYTIKPEDIIHM